MCWDNQEDVFVHALFMVCFSRIYVRRLVAERRAGYSIIYSYRSNILYIYLFIYNYNQVGVRS